MTCVLCADMRRAVAAAEGGEPALPSARPRSRMRWTRRTGARIAALQTELALEELRHAVARMHGGVKPQWMSHVLRQMHGAHDVRVL